MRRQGEGRALWIAVGISLAAGVGLFFAITQVHLPQPAQPEARKSPPTSVALARIDPAAESGTLQQQAMLFDPAPLFLPTAVNTSEPELPVQMRREPGGAAFQPFPFKLTFGEYEMDVPFPDPIAVPSRVVDAIATGETPNPFFRFGRIDQPDAPLPARLGFLEVIQTKTGRTVLTSALASSGDASALAGDWSPLEMLAAVDAAGLVGEPVVVNGSGSEGVDDFFRKLVANQFGLGQRLRPGFYTLRVGP